MIGLALKLRYIIRILSNILHFRNPNTILIKEYSYYNFNGQNAKTIESYIKKFKYHRSYFIERKLKENERFSFDGDCIDTSMIWIQRKYEPSDCFLIFEEYPGTELWRRIETNELANMIVDWDAKVAERTMFEIAFEGKGLNEK